MFDSSPFLRKPPQSENLLTILSGLIGSVIVMAVATPWFVAVLVVVVYFFVRIQRYYSRAAIQLQRFEAVSRSPLYQHFAETLNGVCVCMREFSNISTRVSHHVIPTL